MFSFFAILVCVAEYPQRSRGEKWRLLAVVAIALVCLYFSYARRYYVMAALAIGYFLWVRKTKHTYFTYAGYVFIAILLLTSEAMPIYGRIASIFDFETDAGNIGRLTLWLRAIDSINENPLLGAGVGFEGTIGKTEEETLERVEEGAIAEMYYLKVALEFGVIVGAFFILWLLTLARRSFKEDHFLYRVLPALTIVECIMGGALASPFFAFPFWLIVTQMLRLNKKPSPPPRAAAAPASALPPPNEKQA
jgi:O-antigen ligase